MKRFLINILIKLFFDKQREIKKISLGEEFSKYLFKNADDTIEILKHNRTCMTLWHWETTNQEEATLVKGMGLMLNIILDAHDKALELNKIEEIDKKLLYWKKYKEVEKSSIWKKIKELGKNLEKPS